MKNYYLYSYNSFSMEMIVLYPYYYNNKSGFFQEDNIDQ